MGIPDPNITNKCLGRSGNASFHVNWTAADVDELDGVVFLDPATDLSGIFSGENIAVKRIWWNKGIEVEALIEFDSVGDRREILILPEGQTEGYQSFLSYPDGCYPDPDPSTPSNIVVTTNLAVAENRMDIRLDYKVRGTTQAA